MRIFVTGATGHVGSYLLPRLIRAGHQVVACARSATPKYQKEAMEWDQVEWLITDMRADEEHGLLTDKLKSIECDAVIDLISFTPQQNQMLVDAFIGRVQHFIHCGTIWAYGPSDRVPHSEDDVQNPTSDYGKAKSCIEKTLLELHHSKAFPVSIIRPGHISAKEWLPIDPQGTRNGMGVYEKLKTGQPVALPWNGMPALHHVHADDVAQLFECAIANPQQAIGKCFNAAAPYGMTLKGCCHAVAAYFRKEANLDFVSLEEFKNALGEQAYNTAFSHMQQSIIVSIDKSVQYLGYHPNYSTEKIYEEFLAHSYQGNN